MNCRPTQYSASGGDYRIIEMTAWYADDILLAVPKHRALALFNSCFQVYLLPFATSASPIPTMSARTGRATATRVASLDRASRHDMRTETNRGANYFRYAKLFE